MYKKVANFLFHKLSKDKYKFVNMSYAQEGEDLFLKRYFNNKRKGFFVDVGAHHPIRFSNTYLFYKMGWRGINVDAMPDSMTEFNKVRPDDTNLEMGISEKEGELEFYIFNEPALNTFSQEVAKSKDGLRNYKIIDTKVVETYPLSSVLDKHLDFSQEIDFMSIDVEGLDLLVLQSNNWEKYKPKLILIEDTDRVNLMNIENLPITKFLLAHNYTPIARTFNTLFFERNEK